MQIFQRGFSDAKQPQPEKMLLGHFPGCPDSLKVFAVHFVVHLAGASPSAAALAPASQSITNSCCGELR
jgi:hypothetical protein